MTLLQIVIDNLGTFPKDHENKRGEMEISGRIETI